MNDESSNLFAKLITEIYKNEQLQAKVNQLESTLNEVIEKIKLERKVSLGLKQVYTISVLDQLQNILNKVGGSNE